MSEPYSYAKKWDHFKKGQKDLWKDHFIILLICRRAFPVAQR